MPSDRDPLAGRPSGMQKRAGPPRRSGGDGRGGRPLGSLGAPRRLPYHSHPIHVDPQTVQPARKPSSAGLRGRRGLAAARSVGGLAMCFRHGGSIVEQGSAVLQGPTGDAMDRFFCMLRPPSGRPPAGCQQCWYHQPPGSAATWIPGRPRREWMALRTRLSQPWEDSVLNVVCGRGGGSGGGQCIAGMVGCMHWWRTAGGPHRMSHMPLPGGIPARSCPAAGT